MRRLTFAVVLCAAALLVAPRSATAADTWIEVKSAHFIIWSNADEGRTRTLVWQLEQIRSAIATLWPWARVDLAKPLLVLAAKDENSMRLLAPRYWEEKGAVHPASVWVGGADRNYMAIRADLRGDDRDTLNPYLNAYFTYANLVLSASFEQDLPLWFSRGLAGVLSNTIVRDNFVLLGPAIPSHLQILRESGRLSLAKLVGLTRLSPEYKDRDLLYRTDAQAWAFVHLLMFGKQGAYEPRLAKYSAMLAKGTDPATAFAEALGRVEDYEQPFANYIQGGLYSYTKNMVDAGVKREGFAVRALPGAESAAGRAAWHVAMRRSTEARALIDEARKADAGQAASYVAEGLLLESESKKDEAKAAYAKAVELGSSSPYALYRFAMLTWGPTTDDATLTKIEASLAQAVQLDNKFADAYAALGEARAALHEPADAALGLTRRAIALEPSNPYHHVAAARVLWRYGKLDEAKAEAQAGLKFADDDRERSYVNNTLTDIEAARTAAARRATAVARPSTVTEPAADATTGNKPHSDSTPDANALVAGCQNGDADACRSLVPIAQQACDANAAGACATLGTLYQRGLGVTADPSRAAAYYRRSCDGGERRACVAYAEMQARGSGVPKDEATAMAALEQHCTGGVLEGCTRLALLIAARPNPDLAKVRELLTKSCDGGVTQACSLLKSFPKEP